MNAGWTDRSQKLAGRRKDDDTARSVGANIDIARLVDHRSAMARTKLLSAGQDSVRTVTIAPELPGALDLIEDIASAGVIAAVGHTDATYEQAAAGFAAARVSKFVDTWISNDPGQSAGVVSFRAGTRSAWPSRVPSVYHA
jgi:hypothetical protein